MTPTSQRLAGAAVVLAFLATACSSGNSSANSGGRAVAPTTVATTTTIPGTATPAETDASRLRANLTASLEAQVFLSAVATSVQVTGGDPAPALAALDRSNVDLAGIITTVYDPTVGGQFHALWASRAKLLLAYAKAKAAAPSPTGAAATTTTTGGATPTTLDPVAGATAALDSWRTDVATLVASKNLNLTKEAVADELKPGVQAQLDVIDTQVAKSPTQYDKLAAAALLVPHTAAFVAAGFAKQFPDRYPGTTTGTAANLRAQLTATMVANVYLTGIATATLIGGSDVAPPKATLDANTRSLANSFSAVYGDAAGKQFSDLWVAHTDVFRAYASGALRSDTSAQSASKADASAFAQKFGDFVAGTSKLAPDTVSTPVSSHVETVLAVIDAQAAKSASQFDLLRLAGNAMPKLADVMSESIAVQFPDKFLP